VEYAATAVPRASLLVPSVPMSVWSRAKPGAEAHHQPVAEALVHARAHAVGGEAQLLRAARRIAVAEAQVAPRSRGSCPAAKPEGVPLALTPSACEPARLMKELASAPESALVVAGSSPVSALAARRRRAAPAGRRPDGAPARAAAGAGAGADASAGRLGLARVQRLEALLEVGDLRAREALHARLLRGHHADHGRVLARVAAADDVHADGRGREAPALPNTT
jgi:hypothetical protein